MKNPREGGATHHFPHARSEQGYRGSGRMTSARARPDSGAPARELKRSPLRSWCGSSPAFAAPEWKEASLRRAPPTLPTASAAAKPGVGCRLVQGHLNTSHSIREVTQESAFNRVTEPPEKGTSLSEALFSLVELFFRLCPAGICPQPPWRVASLIRKRERRCGGGGKRA
jgi:hypothetical protein